MYGVDNTTAVAVKPDYPLAGTQGYFGACDPSSSNTGTIIDPYILNRIMVELLSLVTALGGTPDATDDHQIADLLLAKLASVPPALPFASLPFPSIDTAGNVMTVTPTSKAGVGGNVAVPADIEFTVGVADAVLTTRGRSVPLKTVAWISPDLAINSTYYLRAQSTSGGAALFYVQKGADTDTIPAGLLGTPNGASGGGFDSTVLDMLCARIVTGAAGTVPTVTALANLHTLFAALLSNGTGTIVSSPNKTYKYAATLTLNWARTPVSVSVSGGLGGFSGNTLEGGTTYIAPVVSRYEIDGEVDTDWTSSGSFSGGTALGAVYISAGA